MDVIDQLIIEHRRLRSRIDHLESGVGSREAREEAFAALARDLVAHAELEEELVYPRLEEVPELAEEIRHAYQEHHLVDVQLDELAELDSGLDEWSDKIHVLSEVLEHHLEEEEEDVFPRVRKLVPADDLKALGEEFVERRAIIDRRLIEDPPSSAQEAARRRAVGR